ncbi:MAG: ribonuclease R [Bacteroidia bacterium]
MTKRNSKNNNQSKRGRKGKKKNNRQSSLEKHLTETLLQHFKEHKKRQFTVKQLTQELNLFNDVPNAKIRKVLDRMADSGSINYLEKGRYTFAKDRKAGNGGTVTGTLQIVRAGFGFLLVEEGEDIFINADNLDKALDGDTVTAKLIQSRSRRSGNRKTGTIIEIVHRARTEFVGTIEKVGRSWIMSSDDPRMRTDFFIPEEHINGAQVGDKVLVKMLEWERRSPTGEVTLVLGEAGLHNTEMHAILLQYDFYPSFPPEVEAESARIDDELPEAEIAKRKDFRGTTTLTIDPIDAKDFDDAISFKEIDGGLYEVGVHIADVSYYVRPGTQLDKEAFRRGTSVYLVDRTVPMLPEKLSNVVCSLRPNEDKFTYSAVFHMDIEGKVHKRWFGRTVIHSDYRFHYAEAEAVLQGESEGPYKKELLVLNSIAHKLRKKRFKTGSVDFDTPEVKFELDEDGKPLRVVKKIRGDSNKLIEDFMLLANREVAAFIDKMAQNPPLPFVYRIHDTPNLEKLEGLSEFAKGFGYELNAADRNISAALNNLMHEVNGKPEQNVIEKVAIRSMAKAIYTTNNVGHFGLGFKDYTHFTSPIRRYPDLLVHRLVEQYLNKDFAGNPVVLEEQLKYSSNRERTAAEAERESIKYKQVEFLEDKIGVEFDGVISGVIESGIFVELEDNLCEGMVPTWTLEDDHYDFLDGKYALVGRDTGKKYQLGGKVKVRIKGTDIKRRTIDMEMVME